MGTVFGNPSQGLGDQFGFSLAAAGDTILIGVPSTTPQENRMREPHIHNTLDARTGEKRNEVTIQNPNPASGDQFGYSAALLAGGDKLVIGAPKGRPAGDFGCGLGLSLRSHRRPTPDLQQPPGDRQSGGRFGASVAAMNHSAVIGAPSYDSPSKSDVGRVYTYDGTDPNSWQAYDNPKPTHPTAFGQSVAAIGADPVVGAVFVFNGDIRVPRRRTCSKASNCPM